jgi:Ca2+-binding EF-hand superfamily protein
MQARQFVALLLTTMLGTLTLPTAVSGQAQGRGDWRDQQESRGRQMQYRNMDADRDGVVTRAEWRGSLQAFRQADTNDDNVLSGTEVWNTGRGISDNENQGDMSRVFARADRNNDRLLSRDEWYGDLQTFERIDRNDDGRVSLSEFLGEDTAGSSGNRQSFDVLDRNRNGVITASEWSGNEAEFLEIDTNNDGLITRAEFRADQSRTPAFRAGYARGIAEGRQAGQGDKRDNGRWDLDGQRELEQADSGYTQSVGPRDEYQAGYRVGFRRGYTEGFGPR